MSSVKTYLKEAGRWIILSVLISVLVGSACAFFLVSLDAIGKFRETHLWVIAFLPLAGLLIGYIYHQFAGSAVKGNNLLIEEIHNPQARIPLRMAPLVLLGTLLTHLCGGSAGREGTAVQMGGAISDQFSRYFNLDSRQRKIILIMGIAAGFSALFGTPLAAAIFSIEVLIIGGWGIQALVPALLTAYAANYICQLWAVPHTHYELLESIPALSVMPILYAVLAGIAFGLTAWLFSKSLSVFTAIFKKLIPSAVLRPCIGGIILVLIIWTIGNTKYIGLGIPTILASFKEPMLSYDFLLKLLLTSFTLAAGFKGGEVTPLFFIGATLGNILFLFIPLPMALLAAMGFIAVFSGATNTPIACTIMGMELFGPAAMVYFAIACFVAYLCSGTTGIYTAQPLSHSLRARFFYKKG